MHHGLWEPFSENGLGSQCVKCLDLDLRRRGPRPRPRQDFGVTETRRDETFKKRVSRHVSRYPPLVAWLHAATVVFGGIPFLTIGL